RALSAMLQPPSDERGVTETSSQPSAPSFASSASRSAGSQPFTPIQGDFGSPSSARWRCSVLYSQIVIVSPASDICGARPWFLRRQRLALLQQLDRYAVRRANESHMPVARGPADGDAQFLEALANSVDVADPVGQVTEIAPATVFALAPIVRQLDHRQAW